MKSTLFLVLGPVIFALVGSSASSAPLAENAEDHVAVADEVELRLARTRSISASTAIDQLSGFYDIPISFENSLVNDDGSDFVDASFDFEFDPSETLANALDRMCERGGGRFQWTRLRDLICVLPSKSAQKTESTLDTVISGEFVNVSTWEALMLLAGEVNRSVVNERILRIQAYSVDQYLTLPIDFLEERIYSYEFKAVTAREALCAILADSKFDVRFSYWNNFRPSVYPNLKPASVVSLHVYENGEPFRRRSDRFLEEEIAQIRDVELTIPEHRRRPTP